MITEIFIEGYPVDISADLSSLLTFAIDDVKDFATRRTTFSKTVVLPGTSRNNALFGNIFETGHSNDYDSTLDNVGYNFNASKSARCLIFQDNLQTFKGSIRLLEIVKDSQLIEYEVALNGELTNLNVALSTGLLTDLDFSAHDIGYTVANIVASWDNTPGSGVYFPLIDYGNYSDISKHNFEYGTFKPALYVKEYIDKMFLAANYRYECDLFETDRFKGMIVPHNQKRLVQYVTRQVSGSRNNSAQIINSGTTYILPVQMSSVTVTSNFTSTVSDSRFTFIAADPLTLTVIYNFIGSYRANGTAWKIEIKNTGVVVPGSTYNIAQTSDTTTRFYSYSGSLNVLFNTGDFLEIVLTAISPVTGTDFISASNGTLFIDSDVAVVSDIALGDLIKINSTIPKNIRQVDFFTSIVELFNLYVYESQFDENLILIKPYVDYFSTDSSNSVDWTYKLNRDAPQRIKPMSELNSKVYNFKYKDDSDYYNEEYRKRYNQGYGSYIFDSEFEFSSQTNQLELIFAATPLVGYSGEEKVYSSIFKKSLSEEERIDSVIRILQTKKITGVTSWDILDSDGTTVLDSLTTYGYAGHFDDPDSPDNDLNFGALQELYFELVTGNLTNTQFNIYWSPYMAEITDKDSKMLSAKFYLTPKDIFDLDFSKYVNVDGVLFRINKIVDYNATVPSDCEVELIKVINTVY